MKRKAKKAARPRRKKHHHNVYVIELDGRVLNHTRFRDANPNRDMEVELAIALQEQGYAVWQA